MQSSFRVFESFLRMYSPPDEIEIQLVLKQCNSKFNTFPPGAYTFKDLSKTLSRGFKNHFELRKLRPNHIHDKSDSIIIECDNVTLITTLNIKYEIKVLRFDEKNRFLILS